MKLSWTGIALLASSWLFSINYFYSHHWLIWALLAGAGVICLCFSLDLSQPNAPIAAILLLIPCAIFAQWPYRLIPLLLILGALALTIPTKTKLLKSLGGGLIIAGTTFLVQALALQIYIHITGRSHDLPIFSKLLEATLKVLGMNAVARGADLAIFSMRKIHPIGITWELLLDPAVLCFLTGGLAFIFLIQARSSCKTKQLIRHSLSFAVPIIVWLPVKAALMLSIYKHRVLITEYTEPLHLISQFWNPWVHTVLLAIPVVLAIRFVHLPRNGKQQAKHNKARLTWAALLFFFGIILITLAIYWDIPGIRKPGRILIDEYHSQAPWSGKDFDTTRTDKPFDTEWYGHASGYNYASIYDYCTHFYEMSRLYTEIDQKALHEVDVLVLKVPSAPYSDQALRAIRSFVEQGGGLMLMGEHTNVFGSGVHLNYIAQTFGFRFRYDCLFGIDSVFKQKYYSPRIPHPIIRQMPYLDFAVSCSIAPGISSGQAVIRGTGLKSLSADYHVSNFYPQAVDQPEMRYGAFTQLWATRYGRGRVVAFVDSTIFANFSAFEPGKSELMLGMLEWLNHTNILFPKALLGIIGILLCSVGLILTQCMEKTWLIIIAAGMFGWTIAGFGINSLCMKPPKAKHPMVRVAIDQSICGASLPVSGFIAGKKDGFGQFERSILRVGYFPYRSNYERSFDGDLLIFINPNQRPKPGFVKKVDEYVSAGGKLLIVDSPENTTSTANDLLHPFAVSFKHTKDLKGTLRVVPPSLPEIEVSDSLEIAGVQGIAFLDERPVAATVKKGKGTVTLIGFGTRFSDAEMGITGNVMPNAQLRKVFDFEFALLREIVEQKAFLME